MKCFFLLFPLLASVAGAHVVDLHIKTPSEVVEEEKAEEQREIDRAWEVYEDQERSEEERRAALQTLVEKEEIV